MVEQPAYQRKGTRAQPRCIAAAPGSRGGMLQSVAALRHGLGAAVARVPWAHGRALAREPDEPIEHATGHEGPDLLLEAEELEERITIVLLFGP